MEALAREQAMDERDRGAGLAGAGGHRDQEATLTGAEGGLDGGDGANLIRAEPQRGLDPIRWPLRELLLGDRGIVRGHVHQHLGGVPAELSVLLILGPGVSYFLAVPISRDIDVDVVTQLSGLPLDQFRALNPQMNKPVIVAAGTPQLLLPYDNANAFVKSLPLHKGPLSSWTAWTVPKTMKVADAAHAVGMEEDELREVNAIPPRVLVQAGSTLIVARSRNRDGDVSVRMADSAMISFSPDGPALKRVALKVGKGGDSVAAVAKRYAVSAQQVAQWNRVSVNGRLAAGSTVVVYVPNTRGAPSAKTTVRTAKATPSSRAKASAKRSSKPVKVVSGSQTRKR